MNNGNGRRFSNVLIVLICAAFVFGILSLANDYTVEDNYVIEEDPRSADYFVIPHRIVIPDRVVNMSGFDAQSLADDLVSVGADHMRDIQVDSGSVILRIDDDDADWWLSRTDEWLDDMCSRFSKLGDGCRLSIDNTHRNIEFSMFEDTDTKSADAIVTGAEYWCAMWQLFSGDGDGVWRVDMTLYNSDTDKVVATGSYGSDVMGEGLECDESDWERSKR